MIRTQLQTQILKELAAEILDNLGEQQRFLNELLESAQQNIYDCRVSHLARLATYERAKLTQLAKRLFDKSQEGQHIRQLFRQKLYTKLNDYAHLQANTRESKLAVTELFVQHTLENKQSVQLTNYDLVFGRVLTPRLRHMLWQSKLTNENNTKDFYKFDHQTKRVKFDEEMRRQLHQTCKLLQAKLSQDEVDNVLRLLEYLYRKHDKVPTSPRYYLAATLQSVLSNFTDHKINQLGGCFASLLQLTDFYAGRASQEEYYNEMVRAIQLVDADSLQLLNATYTKDSKLLIQTFRDFMNSLGSSLLKLEVASYLIDQLLIKPQNRFDIFLVFAVVVLLVNSEETLEGQEEPDEHTEKMDLLSLLSRARLIKPEAFATAFVHIYQGTTLYESPVEAISNEQAARPGRPIRSNKVEEFLAEHRQPLPKIQPKQHSAKQESVEPVVDPPLYYGLISPPVSLDY